MIYTGSAGLARPLLVSGYRARIRTLAYFGSPVDCHTVDNFIFIDLENMSWAKQRVFDSQKLISSDGQDGLCGGSQYTWALSR